jgi:hypothetical protein
MMVWKPGKVKSQKIEDLLSQLSISDGNLIKRKENEPNHCDRAQININLDNNMIIIIIIITAFSTHFAEPQCVYNLKRPYNLSKKLYTFTAIEL